MSFYEASRKTTEPGRNGSRAAGHDDTPHSGYRKVTVGVVEGKSLLLNTISAYETLWMEFLLRISIVDGLVRDVRV